MWYLSLFYHRDITIEFKVHLQACWREHTQLLWTPNFYQHPQSSCVGLLVFFQDWNCSTWLNGLVSRNFWSVTAIHVMEKHDTAENILTKKNTLTFWYLKYLDMTALYLKYFAKGRMFQREPHTSTIQLVFWGWQLAAERDCLWLTRWFQNKGKTHGLGDRTHSSN